MVRPGIGSRFMQISASVRHMGADNMVNKVAAGQRDKR
jgi:hypothetical protein